jgi:hypothetical protein
MSIFVRFTEREYRVRCLDGVYARRNHWVPSNNCNSQYCTLNLTTSHLWQNLLYLYASVYAAMAITLETSQQVGWPQVTNDHLSVIVQFVDQIVYKPCCINCSNAFYFIFYCNQLLHYYLIKVNVTIFFCVLYTPTCFDTFVPSPGSYNRCLAKIHTCF